jgi:1-acyl-sn-glycerol-3-phosphate acyltransferase
LERYFLEPYRFIPPFRSTFWCRVAKRLIPRHLRTRMGVVRWQFSGTELFHESLAHKAGILLAPNHCRWADPLVMGVFGIQARKYLYYVAAYHLFRQSKVMGWILNRIGGYSIWREGSDRESIKTTVRILADAERPVVLFPEGTWFRQNDRVNPLQDGVSLITRQAGKQSQRPILVHPVGIKYWLLEDPLPELGRRMAAMERRFGWQPQDHLPLGPRIEKLTGALLALKEIEYLSAPQMGTIDERINLLVGTLVERLEKESLGRTCEGWFLERIRRLRQALLRRLQEEKADVVAAAHIKKNLETLLFCENINAHSYAYLHEAPSLERLTETVQRLEEILTDGFEAVVVPMGVTVTIGPAIDVRSFSAARKGERTSGVDPFVGCLRTAIQEQIDHLLAQGPPAEWGCPAPRKGFPVEAGASCSPAVDNGSFPIADLSAQRK